MLVELYWQRRRADKPEWPDGGAYLDQPLQLIHSMSVIHLYYQQNGGGDQA